VNHNTPAQGLARKSNTVGAGKGDSEMSLRWWAKERPHNRKTKKRFLMAWMVNRKSWVITVGLAREKGGKDEVCKKQRDGEKRKRRRIRYRKERKYRRGKEFGPWRKTDARGRSINGRSTIYTQWGKEDKVPRRRRTRLAETGTLRRRKGSPRTLGQKRRWQADVLTVPGGMEFATCKGKGKLA